jgi:hypothetical protein
MCVCSSRNSLEALAGDLDVPLRCGFRGLLESVEDVLLAGSFTPAKPAALDSLRRTLERHARSTTGGRPAEPASERGARLVDQQALSSIKALERDGLAGGGQAAAADTLIASLTHEHEAVMSVLREAVESA